MSMERFISAELQLLVATVREFVTKEIVPYEDELRVSGARGLPDDLVKRLQAKARPLGLWCFGSPAEYGGAGLTAFELVNVLEAAVRHTFSLPDAGHGTFGYDPPAALFGASPEQREQYLVPTIAEGRQWFLGITEPSGGSDPARAIRTRATRTSSGWQLTGRKQFTSRAADAEHGIVFARTSGEDGEGISAFIVPRDSEGLEYRRVDVMRDHHTYEVTLDGVEVPEENLLGKPGQGFALAKDSLARGRLGLSAKSLGVAQMALEMATEYAKERETFGKPLATRQAVQWFLADSLIELRAARWLLWEAAWAVDDGGDGRVEASIAKLSCTETAYRIVDRAIQIFGGMGVCAELPLEHWFRALRVNRIVEGPSEIHRYVVARDMLGVSARA